MNKAKKKEDQIVIVPFVSMAQAKEYFFKIGTPSTKTKSKTKK